MLHKKPEIGLYGLSIKCKLNVIKNVSIRLSVLYKEKLVMDHYIHYKLLHVVLMDLDINVYNNLHAKNKEDVIAKIQDYVS